MISRIATGPRPRIEGERELEILQVTLQVLSELGYDRLTLDAVAARSRASKATLYRRWASKAELVAEALAAMKTHAVPVDTGSLAGDLTAVLEGHARGELDLRPDLLCGLATAMGRDGELRRSVHRMFIAPQQQVLTTLLERARDRGEIDADVDVDLFASLIPALAFYQLTFADGPSRPLDHAQKIINQVILPALHRRTG